MPNHATTAERQSTECLAFEHYLRTGRRLSPRFFQSGTELKFNPYHDPRNGRFTFAPGGAHAPGYAVNSRQRNLHTKRPKVSALSVTEGTASSSATVESRTANQTTNAVYRPDQAPAAIQPSQYRPNPRARMSGNGGPPLNDPMTLERVFPGLPEAPGGSIVAIADNILDISGPASRLTSALTEEHINVLVQQIRSIDPNYRLDTLGFPRTLEGQANLIRQLRIDRAATFFREKLDLYKWKSCATFKNELT
ncbi:hypothetical protein [Novosphingobium album (ex Hu et al. 2023)]|uniref:Uncharacterized protein n=1 Tax=Novosphingobium album (ex Hu et al. 2023) TaxID=2930093 RepID=A0ABT0B236_9SPHN|nr:hypothetical protein [Novosphingobium album (ex Hu et al. 2023)]MCJ2178993.1 hypothetical protein [Novosphingobium album (ex Hu et al. 2023)]